MALRARAEANRNAASFGGGICTIERIRGRLSPEDVADLDALLADEDMPSSIIARTLGEEGHRIGSHVVTRHRRKECRCGQTG